MNGIQRLVLLLLTTMLIILLGSCGFANFMSVEVESSKEVAERIIPDIVQALDEQDSVKLAALFHKNISSSNDFAEQSEQVIEFYKGTSTAIEVQDSSEEEIFSKGLSVKEFFAFYYVTTTEDIYRIKFQYQIYNRDTPSDAGLYYLQICTDRGFDADGTLLSMGVFSTDR